MDQEEDEEEAGAGSHHCCCSKPENSTSIHCPMSVSSGDFSHMCVCGGLGPTGTVESPPSSVG